MNPITACMIVRNEAPIIGRRLRELRPHVSEIAVIDQCSTDGTWEIVRELADYAIQLPAIGIADPDKNLVYGMGRQPWVLSMDADEALSPQTVNVLGKLTASEEELFWFPRVDYVEGAVMPFLKMDYQPRLFKRGALAYSGQAHTHPEIRTRKCCLVPDCPIYHQRSWASVQSRNRARDCLGPEVRGKQERYIRQVGDFLRQRGRIQ